MKKIILLLMLAGIARAQQDTIFTKNGVTILCTITGITSDNIFFTNSEGQKGRYVDKRKVVRYSQEGKTAFTTPVIKDSASADKELNFLRSCLKRHSKEYFTGVTITGVGLAGSIVGGALSAEFPDTGFPIIIASGVVALVGTIVTIDSHKWFKRAALGVTGSGAYVRYTF